MEDNMVNILNSLRADCENYEQRIASLTHSLEKMQFEHSHQMEALKGELWKSNKEGYQLLNQLQSTQAECEQSKKYINHLETENVNLRNQIRRSSASKAELEHKVEHLTNKSDHLEFNLDYKNYLLSGQQELYENDIDLRADIEYNKTLANLSPQVQAILQQPGEAMVSPFLGHSTSSFDPVDLALEEGMDMMGMDDLPFLPTLDNDTYTLNSPKPCSPTLAPVRSSSFNKCQREASKLSNSRRVNTGRKLRKAAANKAPVAPSRRK